LFLTALNQRAGVKPWQIQQAADAIRIYRYQYRDDSGKKEDKPRRVGISGSDETLLDRLLEVIRLRHYAKSTEKTYLHWTRRFLAYREQAGLAGEPAASDVKAFLTRLAMVEKVSASTQNQAFSALLLLCSAIFSLPLFFIISFCYRRETKLNGLSKIWKKF
jgi:hypothetical protein